MIRKIYITEKVFPVPEEIKATALAAGAEMILSGVPPKLIGTVTVNGDTISAETRGYAEYDEPEPIPATETEEQTRTISVEAIIQLESELNDPSVNSISEVKSALVSFLNSIK